MSASAVQYIATQPTVTYATQPAYMTQPAQVMTYAAQPTAPVTTYMSPQPMQYVVDQPPAGAQYIMQDGQLYLVEDPGQQQVQYVTADGQLVTGAEQVQYVTADGQLISGGEQVQYVMGGQEVQYVQTEDGQLLQIAPQYEYGQQFAYAQAQPEIYNISPEQFARLAAGGALTEQEMYGDAPMPAVDLAAQQPDAAAAGAGIAVAAKSEKKSKKKLASKKAKKGCC